MSLLRYVFRSQRHWVFIILLLAGAAAIYLVADSPGARLAEAERGVTVRKDIPYVEGSLNPKQKLDLYLPKKARPFPVVIFVHGGFWRAGDRRYYEPMTGLYGNIGVALASHGIGVVIPSYRLSPSVDIRGQVDDISRALAWTAANIASEGGDPSRIYLMGHSAGAQIVSLLGTDRRLLLDAGIPPSIVKGVIALSGIYDLNDMALESDAAFNESLTYPHFGRTTEELASWSPVEHVGRDSPTFLIGYGGNDISFAKKEAEQFAQALRDFGRPPITVEVPGFTHNMMVFRFNSDDDALSGMIVQFIRSRR